MRRHREKKHWLNSGGIAAAHRALGSPCTCPPLLIKAEPPAARRLLKPPIYCCFIFVGHSSLLSPHRVFEQIVSSPTMRLLPTLLLLLAALTLEASANAPYKCCKTGYPHHYILSPSCYIYGSQVRHCCCEVPRYVPHRIVLICVPLLLTSARDISPPIFPFDDDILCTPRPVRCRPC